MLELEYHRIGLIGNEYSANRYCKWGGGGGGGGGGVT